MENILENKNDLLRPPRVGQIVEGKIIGIDKKGFFLDLGGWGTGIIYGKEFVEGKEILKNQKIGDTLYTKVISLDNEEGFIELSVAQAGKEIAWLELLDKKGEGELIKAKILKANKGGLITEIKGIPAFLPVSQLSPEHYPRVPGGETAQILRELQKFIGQELEVKILTLDQKANQLILSEKAKEAEKVKEILKDYKVGDIVEGEITGIVDFGVFIKFLPSKSLRVETSKGSALEGLIHISELDWKIIEDPSEVVEVGEIVKAKIIDISDNKVSLSLKALKKDPWEGIEEKYKKGDTVSGKITKFNPFGAFVQITPRIQGLCHISEFGSQKKMQETLKIGKKYNFKILLIEPKEHRMTLKLIKE
jgi:small subunit ribosomal protein S1